MKELFGVHLVLILSVVFCCFLWSLVVGKLLESTWFLLCQLYAVPF
jgi:hypothetical protein